MEDAIKNYEDVDSWKTVIFLYNAAMKEVGTKLEILNDEFQHVHKYNPIEHIKDYIKNPKESGYKSYHMLVSVPIFLSDSVVDTKVEIQIRTIAMDFWASLEHKIYYKFEGDAPDYISRELQECAQMVSELDDKMLSLNEAIQACLEVENTPVPVELVKENQEQEKKQEDIVEHILGKES